MTKCPPEHNILDDNLLIHNHEKKIFFNVKHYISDVAGLGFSGFGRARAFVYRASGGPGFFASGFGPVSGFSKV